MFLWPSPLRDAGAERFMKQTAIARSAAERAEFRSSRGSACLALSSGTFAVSLFSLDRLRRARGFSVLGAVHSWTFEYVDFPDEIDVTTSRITASKASTGR